MDQSELWTAVMSNSPGTVAEVLKKTVVTDEQVNDLARSYEIMKLKNISLPPQIEYHIAYKLIDNRFFMPKDKKNVQESKLTEQNVATRINIIKQHSEYLVANYHQKDLDSIFALKVQIIAQHLMILKKYLKTTYDVLPWEEMEFCLLLLLLITSNGDGKNGIYKLVLDKRRVLNYLRIFTDTLCTVGAKLRKNDINSKLRVPSRDTSIKSVIKNNPDFKDMYADYEIVRDIYSLTKINYYIDEALKSNNLENRKLKKLIIQRTLQVIGENLKSSTESPNVSTHVHSILLKSAPSGLKETITMLRDSLSHAHSLVKRLHIEGNQNELFIKIINDLKLIQSEIFIVLNERKLQAVFAFTSKVKACPNMDSMKYLSSQVTLKSNIFGTLPRNDFAINEVEKIDDLLNKIDKGINDKTTYEAELLKKISHILHLQKEKTKISETTSSYLLGEFRKTVYNMKNSNNLDHIKNMFSILEQKSSLYKSDNKNYFKEVISLLNYVYISLRSRKLTSEFKEVDGYINHLMITLHIESDSVKEIGNFKTDLDKDEDSLETSNEQETDHVIENIFSLAIPENLKKKIKQGYEDKKLIPGVKSRLSAILKEMKQDESYEMNEQRMTEWEDLVKKLETKKQTEESLISYYRDKNTSGLESLLNLINDTYSALCKSFKDHNITVNDKQQNAIKNFLASLKLRKNETDDVMKKFMYQVEEKIKNYYTDRLSILSNLLDSEIIITKIMHDKSLKIIIEALLLDLFEILEDMSLFSDNRFFVDDFAPLLVGKALRNYLAHGNVFLDTLAFPTSLSLLVNAFKLVECDKDLLDKKQIIGRINTLSDEFIEERYAECLSYIELQMDMLHYATKNDIHNMKQCLEKGANLLAMSFEGDGVLKYTTKEDALVCFEFAFKQLLKIEHDINERTKQLQVALGEACINGSYKIIDFYIANNLNLTCSSDGTTILHLLAKHGHVDILEKLIVKDSFNVSVYNKHKLSPLHMASEYNHFAIVKILLTQGCSTRDKSLCLSTALHYACRNGHLEITRLLLEQETTFNDCVNEPSSSGNTPLHLSAENGHDDIVSLLLQFGANPFLKNSGDYTPLELGVICGHLNIVEILFDAMFTDRLFINVSRRPACPDTIEETRYKPFRLACYYGHMSISEFFIKKQLDVNKVYKDGTCMIHMAAEKGWTDLAEMLIAAGADVNAANRLGYTPLHFACCHGHTRIVTALLTAGAKVNVLDHAGLSPLCMACTFDFFDIIVTLLDRGADVNLTSVKHITPLLAAVYSGNLEMLELLLKAGAAVDAKTSKGVTALHLAAKTGSDAIVTQLLNYSALIDAKDENHYTPLHIACGDGYTSTARMLLDRGAQMNATTFKGTELDSKASELQEDVLLTHAWSSAGPRLNVNGLTPIHLAAQNRHADTVALLLERGARFDEADESGVTPLALAAQSGHAGLVRLLAGRGADVNARMKDDLTPLLCAVQADCARAAGALLRAGADVDAANCNGYTSLHVASLYGYVHLARLLLEDGASTAARTVDGNTPLHTAVVAGSCDIVRTLLATGADPDALGLYGTTPLEFAVYTGNRQMVALLCESGACVNLRKPDSDGVVVVPPQVNSYTYHSEILAEMHDKISEKDPCSVLAVAVQQGFYELVCDLLSYGADPNFMSCDSATMFPLHTACLKGFSDIVQTLLEHGADIEASSLEQFTPLLAAVQGNRLDVVRILLDAGAKVNVSNIEGATPLVMAVEVADVDVIEELLKHGAEVDRAFNDVTPLYFACKQSDFGKAKILLEHQANVHKATRQRWTPLHAAASSADNEELVGLLLDYGADAEFTSIEGLRPMHLAAQNGHVKVVNVLLSRGARYNDPAFDGATPLYLASCFGHVCVVKCLLQRGADPNIAAVGNSTPLHSAVINQHADIVRELLRAKVDVNVRNAYGHTPLRVAIIKFSKEIICDLLINGALIDPYIEHLMQMRLTELVTQ